MSLKIASSIIAALGVAVALEGCKDDDSEACKGVDAASSFDDLKSCQECIYDALGVDCELNSAEDLAKCAEEIVEAGKSAADILKATEDCGGGSEDKEEDAVPVDEKCKTAQVLTTGGRTVIAAQEDCLNCLRDQFSQADCPANTAVCLNEVNTKLNEQSDGGKVAIEACEGTWP